MFISWSKIGSYHTQKRESNQDTSFCVEDGKSQIIVLADGVSSCSHAREGATIACINTGNYYAKCGSELMWQSKDVIAKKTIQNIVCALNKKSSASGIAVDEYSSTIAVVYYDKASDNILIVNVGDGIVCGVNSKGYEVLMQPQDSSEGCFVTTTKGVERKADIKVYSAKKYNNLFICSDGMWQELFGRTRLKKEYESYILKNDYSGLISQLETVNFQDDGSIVVMTKTHEEQGDAA